MSELQSIVYKPEGAAPSPNGYIRVPLQEAQLVVGKGIQGDLKGGHPTRQLNIMSAETMAALAQEGFQVAPGQLGEQLVVAGLTVDQLPAGTRLQVGETACVEVTMPRTGCDRFASYQGIAQLEAAGRLGVMAKVVTAGTIRVGDPVTILTD
jgi:MOSC domain-containing protein YiiM